MPSVYPNDYVFSLDDIKNKLIYLLATTSNGIQDITVIYKQFIDMLKKHNISEEEHINLLKRTEKIETRIKECYWIYKFASDRCGTLYVL